MIENNSYLKADIRTQMLAKRGSLDKTAKSRLDDSIVIKLIQKSKDAHVIHTYLPMDSEINLYPFITYCLEKGKIVVCPQAQSKGVFNNLILESLDNLDKGVLGTQHPSGGNVYHGHYDLIVVPGLAFDQNGFRIGYGGGYYDRFLFDKSAVFKVGACYAFQFFDHLPTNEYDIPVDEVLVM